MKEQEATAYVRASAALQGLKLDPERAQRVGMHLLRTAQMAQLLDAIPMTPEDEIAEIYSPNAFQPLQD